MLSSTSQAHVHKLVKQHPSFQQARPMCCRLVVLKDWKTLAHCLDTDVSSDLPIVEVLDIATVLSCCVQLAVEAEMQEADKGPVLDLKSRKRHGEGAEGKGSVQQDVTLALMHSVPRLLKQYSTEPRVVRVAIGFGTPPVCVQWCF
jgi:hypothetical protein